MPVSSNWNLRFSAHYAGQVKNIGAISILIILANRTFATDGLTSDLNRIPQAESEYAFVFPHYPQFPRRSIFKENSIFRLRTDAFCGRKEVTVCRSVQSVATVKISNTIIIALLLVLSLLVLSILLSLIVTFVAK